MNGKGDKDRTSDRSSYRRHYDQINWHRQDQDEHARRLARQEDHWWQEHERVRTENSFRGQMFKAHGITTNQ